MIPLIGLILVPTANLVSPYLIMAFAPPISRDGFYYNGDLYVEVGGLNRHKRASASELTAILRPDLKKAKATPQPSKDPVGHWYEAQLIHYGLPPSKDKARAKMRLLEAVNTSNLDVPTGIMRLEESLRKEFNAAEKKAKALHKAQMAPQSKEAPPSKKRKQPDATNINVTINNCGAVGSQFGTMPSLEAPSPAKKAKTQPVKATNKKQAIKTATPTNQPTPAKKEPTASKQASSKKGSIIKEVLDVKKTTVAVKQPAKDKPVVKNMPTTKKEPAIKKESVAKKEPAVKKESAVKKEPAVKKERAPKPETRVKIENSSLDQRSDPEKHTLGLINGHYEITCPYITQEWNCHDLSLTLCLDSPKVWGAYDFGMFEGIILIPKRPYRASETPIPCQWAGRENGEGEMTFGDDCVGEIAFLGGGRIRGTLRLLGECDFTGIRQPGPPPTFRSAASMREEWEGYNEDTYEKERVSRW